MPKHVLNISSKTCIKPCGVETNVRWTGWNMEKHMLNVMLIYYIMIKMLQEILNL